MDYSNTRQKLKRALRCNDYSRYYRILRQLGFVIEGKKGKHPHLSYNHNGKPLLFVLPATGSDRRNGLNLVSDIMRKLARFKVFD